MAKTNSQRQRAWKAIHKNDPSCKELRKKINKTYYNKVNANQTSTEKLLRQKDARLRKQKSRAAARSKRLRDQLLETPKKISPSALGKAIKRALHKGLPKSPRTRRVVLSKISEMEGIELAKKSPQILRNRLSEDTTAKVIKFYQSEEISRVDPGFKTATVTRQRTIVARRNLLFTISEVFTMFKTDHPEVLDVGRSKFASLRPKHVKPYRDLPHNVCVCRYHENFSTLHQSLSEEVVGLGSSVNELVSNVCDKHSSKCMYSECLTCSDIFKDVFSVEWQDPDDKITYKQWKQVEKRIEHVVEVKSVSNALEEMVRQFKPFLAHSFNVSMAQSHFNSSRNSATRENVILQVDFAENYSCSYQDEIQSAHWNNPQVALFTAVVWFGPTDEDIQSYVITSDNITHDRYCVNMFLRDVITEHKNKNPDMTNLHVFSDGSACQFKQKYNFANITLIKEDFELDSLTWTFFATSHGKGAVDGVGATVKRRVWNAVRAKKAVVRNALSFTELCSASDTKVCVRHIPAELIEDSKLQLDTIWDSVETVKGTQKIHHVIAHSRYEIEWKLYPQQDNGNRVFLNSKINENVDQEQPTNEVNADNVEESQNTACLVPQRSADEVGQPVQGQWVAVAYDQQWLPGFIESFDGLQCTIKFMKSIGPNRFVWPDKPDYGTVNYKSILAVMQAYPELISYTGRSIHTLPAPEYLRLIELYIKL